MKDRYIEDGCFMKVSDEFNEIISRVNATERDVHRFLKKYPYVLIHLCNNSWNFYHIFSEYRLGTDFRADFVIISADSGRWHGHFIELKGPNDAVYTKEGQPGKKLGGAIGQTHDWRNYVDAHRVVLKHEFAKLIRPLKKPAQNNLMFNKTTADIELAHPNTSIHFDYHIVVGNSQKFTESDKKAHRDWSVDKNVLTYDRVYKAMLDIESRYSTLQEQRAALSSKGN